MNKKLYYTIEREVDDSCDELSLTGMKQVTVYEIIDNKPKMFTLIECELSCESEEEILNYLNDNGYGDETIEFEKL